MNNNYRKYLVCFNTNLCQAQVKETIKCPNLVFFKGPQGERSWRWMNMTATTSWSLRLNIAPQLPFPLSRIRFKIFKRQHRTRTREWIGPQPQMSSVNNLNTIWSCFLTLSDPLSWRNMTFKQMVKWILFRSPRLLSPVGRYRVNIPCIFLYFFPHSCKFTKKSTHLIMSVS